ncbi:MAG: hypothetical protein NC822_05055 [Candidatus Omnitrophica bacterium]|nr:hypothetical protein [Candidatus Omnitrophota bacterium]MCM8826696.1 hypothetical protein [Candidatus Omnitrophota bacterium]
MKKDYHKPEVFKINLEYDETVKLLAACKCGSYNPLPNSASGPTAPYGSGSCYIACPSGNCSSFSRS